MLPSISLKKLCFCIFLLFTAISCSNPDDFYYINGQGGKITDYKGKWLLINYWAEWCKPCIEEVPELNRFYSQHAESYAMLSVSFDPISSEELNQQMLKFNMQYPMIVSSPKPNLGIKMPGMLPANYILSPEGKVFGPLLGPQTVESLLKAFKKVKQINLDTIE